MSEQCELLIVADTFQITNSGLVLVPDFPTAQSQWKSGTTTATVVKPNGEKLTAVLSLYVWHFNIRDPEAPVDKRWRIVPSFRDLKEDDVPVGSRIFVDCDVFAAIKGST